MSTTPLSEQIVTTRRFQRPGEPVSVVVEYADGRTGVVSEVAPEPAVAV